MIKRYETISDRHNQNFQDDFKILSEITTEEIQESKIKYTKPSLQTLKNKHVFPGKTNLLDVKNKINNTQERSEIIYEKSLKNSLKRCYKIYELFDDDSLAQSFSFKLSKYDTMIKFFNKEETKSKIIFGTNFKDEEKTNFQSIYSIFSKNSNEFCNSKNETNSMISFGIAPHKILRKLCNYFNIDPKDNLIKKHIISFHEKLSHLHIFEYYLFYFLHLVNSFYQEKHVCFLKFEEKISYIWLLILESLHLLFLIKF